MNLPRDEHLEWARKRAIAYLEQPVPEVLNALTSMMSDLNKHPELENHPGIRICVGLLLIGNLQTPSEARRFIDGYH